MWRLATSTDPIGRRLADDHYSRQKPGTRRFVPPGRCMTLVTTDETAVWATSWPFAQYVKHAWAGAWICSIFRNTGPQLSSDLIREAVAHSKWYWGEVPELGMVTFVDASKVRRKRDPGRCFLKAGFVNVGETKGGLVALQLLPSDMPEAAQPGGHALWLPKTRSNETPIVKAA